MWPVAAAIFVTGDALTNWMPCQQTEHRNRGEEATGAAHLNVAVRPHDGWGRTAKLVYAFQLMLYRLSYPLTVNFTSRVMVFFPALSVILMARRY